MREENHLTSVSVCTNIRRSNGGLHVEGFRYLVVFLVFESRERSASEGAVLVPAENATPHRLR